MKLVWAKLRAGMYGAMAGAHDFRIEKTSLGWEVWYSKGGGAETLVGVGDTLSLAKEAGSNVADTVIR